MRYLDRREAGLELAGKLRYLRGHHALVLGLPRGGVVVAREVANALEAPLDVLLVRKFGAPGRPDPAVGAVSEGGVVVTDHEVVRRLGLTQAEITQAANRERAELTRLRAKYHGVHHVHPVTGQLVVLVDDGVATGSTAHAAIRVLRARGAGHLVLAVPVGSIATLDELARSVDRVVCPHPLRWMHAIGNSYNDFTLVEDDEVLKLLGAEPAQPTSRR